MGSPNLHTRSVTSFAVIAVVGLIIYCSCQYACPSRPTAASQPASAPADAPVDWGKPVQGIQARLRPDKQTWKQGETPTFKGDIRNNGTGVYSVAQAQELCEPVLDGTTYRWFGGFGIKSSYFPPGRQYNDIPIVLENSWHVAEPPVHGNTGNAHPSLALATGKHTLIVVFHCDPDPSGNTRNSLSVQTNPVDFEVAAPTSAPAEWHPSSRAVPADLPREVAEQIKLLVDNDPKRRAMGAWYLGRMGEKAAPAIPWLVDLLHDPYQEPAPAFSNYTRRLTVPSEFAAEALVAIGAPAADTLLRELQDPDLRARESVVWAVGKSKDLRFIAPLLGALKDAQWEVRAGAAFSLAELNWSGSVSQKTRGEVVQALIAAQRDSQSEVRYRVVIAFQFYKDPVLMEPLLQAAKDPDGMVRKGAQGALRAYDDPRAVDALIAALTDSDEENRRHAREGLEWITDQKFGADADTWRQWWSNARAKWHRPKFSDTQPATGESETITVPPEVKIAWNKQTPPDVARVAFQSALKPHVKNRDNRVRMTWFLHGQPRIAMICEVSLVTGKVYTAREVYDWATQGAQWGERLDEAGIAIFERISRELPPSENSVDSRYCVLVSAATPGGRELRVYDRRKLPDKIERLYEIVEAHIGYYPQEAAADNDQAEPTTQPLAADSHPARADALAAQAKEVRAKHPTASRKMWEQLAALVQPGMTVGDLESVLGTPSDGNYNQYLHRNTVTLIYRLSDRFRVRAEAEFASPTDTLEHAILLAPPQIEDEHLVHEEPRPTPATAPASSGR